MNRKVSIERLSKKAYRDAYVESRIKTDLAFQIRLLRDKRGWKQKDLARMMGVSQARIAQLENPSYGKYSSQTLRRLAGVFDVALVQRFVSFGELLDWASGLSETRLCPDSFHEDQQIAAMTGQRPLSSDATFKWKIEDEWTDPSLTKAEYTSRLDQEEILESSTEVRRAG